MLSRGTIIGKVIDDLTMLENQIHMRCQAGLTDLNKFSEDFVKVIINTSFELKLDNLNINRSNSPGIDLGDKKKRVAFQVTSTASSEKVNDTLEVLTAEQLKDFQSIKILILGKKQGSYSAVKKELLAKCNFSVETDILDFSDLVKKIITIEFDSLFELNKLFEKEMQKVIFEFEIPTKEGKYLTNYIDKLEIAPNTVCENAEAFIVKFPHANLSDIQREFLDLAKLPRITRDFLLTVMAASEIDMGNYSIKVIELVRKLPIGIQKIKEEATILYDKGFIFELDEDEDSIRTRFSEQLMDLIEFAGSQNSLSKFLVALDFTILDSGIAKQP
jgi:hypothetical protein